MEVLRIRCRCGVNTAQIFAGNIGSTQRMKYGVLGDGINLTARMKSLTSRYNTQTIIGETTFARVHNMIACRPLDLVAVKGKSLPTKLYDLMEVDLTQGPGKEKAFQAVKMHCKAFALYLECRFDEAKKLFQEVNSSFASLGVTDGPSQLMINRCEGYLRKPPPPDWDGVDRLTKKTFGDPLKESTTSTSASTRDQEFDNDAFVRISPRKTPSSKNVVVCL